MEKHSVKYLNLLQNHVLLKMIPGREIIISVLMIKKRRKTAVRDRAWFVHLYGEIIPNFSKGIIDHTGAQTMLCLSCTVFLRL